MTADCPPIAVDAERWCIGSALLHPACIPDLLEHVGERDFRDSFCRAAFKVISERHRSGQPIDPGLVGRAIRESEGIEADVVAVTLIEIGEAVPTAAHAEHYAKIVREASIKWRVYSAAFDAVEASCNGRAASSVLNDLLAAADDLRREAGPSGNRRFNLITAADLAAQEWAVEYLIDNVLAAREHCILGGPKKALKTTFLCGLAVALATLVDFLGKFPINRQCRVLLASGESGMAVLKETTSRICRAHGFELSDIGADVVFCAELPKFNNPDHLAELEGIIESEGIDVALIDPAFKCMPGAEAGNLMIQGQLLDAMSEVCVRTNSTLVLAHHAKATRAKPNDPLDLDDLSWAGFAEWARQWLLLNRREPYEEGSGQHRMWLTVGGSAGHSGLWGVDVSEGGNSAAQGREWGVDVTAGRELKAAAVDDRDARRQRREEEKIQQQAEADRRRVVEAMTRIGGPETQSTIQAGARISGSRTKAALMDLESEKMVRRVPIERANKQTYEGFELCSE